MGVYENFRKLHDTYKAWHYSREAISSGNHNYFIQKPVGIGDAVIVLSFAERLIEHDKDAAGRIYIECDPIQAQLYEHDPRVKVFRHDMTDFDAILGMKDPEKFRGSRRIMPSFCTCRDAISRLRRGQQVNSGDALRKTADDFFHQSTPLDSLNTLPKIFLGQENIDEAKEILNKAIGVSNTGKVIMVNPDTSSYVTRPPVDLLADALNLYLSDNSDANVVILPSYTVSGAASTLIKRLKDKHSDYSGKIIALYDYYPENKPVHLLTLAAILDLSDVVITGDTGLMHIAMAEKVIAEGTAASGNRNRIVSVWGGTNPNVYGYHNEPRFLFAGAGSEYQRRFRPGILKENADPHIDYFSHVKPVQIYSAINQALEN